MKIKLVLICFLMLLVFPKGGHAQVDRLSAFDYLVVPDRFDFQFEPDQYQLNSLLKFLFNKHGFHAFFTNELPDVRRCDGLYVRLDHEPGFIWTEVTIKLVDCDGILYYQTKTGRSKLKQFDKVYSQAIRMAFESIEILGVRQEEVVVLSLAKKSDESEAKASPAGTLSEPLATQAEPQPQPQPSSLYPSEAYLVYTHDGERYVLRKTNTGHQLYHEVGADLIFQGKLFQVDETLFFEDLIGQRFLAVFSQSGDLNLEREATKIIYKRTN
ncbi:MAG: hypothetical protein ABR84_07365 [Cryomorphaceae bacterium BACL21 MAG-121220-bin10]|jgi:hemin uptake protein HemP|nr:MAG: hypothetical protein ABR84_07365 [Cryomorphaceae bacterium BACL21 MAG-121220-bin10]